MGWRDEFPGDGIARFDVPESIVRMEGLKDLSWRNNVCPSFGVELSDSMVLQIWCDAVDQEQREGYLECRFNVSVTAWDETSLAIVEAAGLRNLLDDDCGMWVEFSTDDPAEAVAIFLRVLPRLQAARRAVA